MWAVNNQTPFAAAACWGRDREGRHEWWIGVKASYDVLEDGQLRLSREQPEVLSMPQYQGPPGRSSLRYDTELLAVKPCTDIILNGTAYAPNGRPSADFMVQLEVGPVRKRLRVRGDGHQGQPLSGRTPMLQVPVVYERAAGGHDDGDADPRRHRLDTRNPVGCTIASEARRQGRVPLPNIEYPGRAPADGAAGFGALDSAWSPRREKAGTYDAAWREERLPALPVDWHPDALLCAPADQRPPAHLQGGERVILTNLTPEGRMSFVLPRGVIEFETQLGRERRVHPGTLGSLVIEPDLRRVLLVWQGALSGVGDVDALDKTVVRARRAPA